MVGKTQEPTIGRHLFDILTKGMYADPLCIYREYIQNSADAIDHAIMSKQLDRSKAEIKIHIDPELKKIVIEDNGCGIAQEDVKRKLSSIGESEKLGLDRERGFRGIGRLGGMAYCQQIKFVTKARGEDVVSINTWNCGKIAEMVNPNDKRYKGISIIQVINECSEFSEEKADNSKEGYFRVEMYGVESNKGILLDVKEVRSYLSQVAPVPYDYQKFPQGKELDEKMLKEVKNYNIFRILVNYEDVFKPYKTTIQLSKSNTDKITSIIDFDILDNGGKIIARGWRAEREQFLGAVLKSEGVAGIRVRVGNIQIGNESLLDKVFREDRFNSYLVGEIHVCDPQLIPTSQRDDFEDNVMKETFYDSLSKQIGSPLSERIRKASIEHSKAKSIKEAEACILTVKSSIGKGFVSPAHEKDLLSDLRNHRNELEKLANGYKTPENVKRKANATIDKIKSVCEECNNGSESITKQLSDKYTNAQKEVVEEVFKCIYNNFDKANTAVKLIDVIVGQLNKNDK